MIWKERRWEKSLPYRCRSKNENRDDSCPLGEDVGDVSAPVDARRLVPESLRASLPESWLSDLLAIGCAYGAL